MKNKIIEHKIMFGFSLQISAETFIDIPIRYWLSSKGIESRWRRYFPHFSRPAMGPSQPLHNGFGSLSRGLSSRGLALSAHPIYKWGQRNSRTVESSWSAMAHGDAQEGKWRGNWWMEWVASILHTTSEHGVSSNITADAHTSAASSRLNWPPLPI